METNILQPHHYHCHSNLSGQGHVVIGVPNITIGRRRRRRWQSQQAAAGVVRVFARHHQSSHDHHDNYRWGRLVDEDMITLRLRIKELTSSSLLSGLGAVTGVGVEEEDNSNNNNNNNNWMEWEKRYSDEHRFHSDVYALVGMLQSTLVSCRPSIALGMVAFVSLSIPTTVGVFLFHTFMLFKQFLS